MVNRYWQFWGALLSFFFLLVGCQTERVDPPPAPIAGFETAVSPNAITPENAIQLVPLHRLGDGVMTHIAYNPIAEQIAVGTTFGVYLYGSDWAEPLDFYETDEPIETVAFSPDGQLLAFVSRPSHTAQFWRIAERALEHTIKGNEATPGQLRFSPDGGRAVVSVAGEVVVIVPDTGAALTHIETPPGAQLFDPTFSPDGATLAATILTGQVGAINLWDLDAGELSHTLQTETPMQLNQGRFSPDGAFFGAVGSEPLADIAEKLTIWDLTGAEFGQPLSAPASVFGRAWTIAPDSNHIAASLLDGRIALWQRGAVSPTTILGAETANLATAVAFTPDSQTLLVGRVDGRVQFWRVGEGTMTHELHLPADAIRQFIQPGDGTVIVAAEDGLIVVLDSSGQVQRTLTRHAHGGIQSLAFAPDAPMLAVGSANGFVEIWDADQGERVNALPEHGGAVQSVAFGSSADLFATGVGERIGSLVFDDTVRIWQGAEKQAAHQFGGELEAVAGCSTFRNSVAFSRDGRLLASGSHDFTVKVWDVATGELAQTLDGHRSSVFGVAFSPDSAYLASASDDGFVRVWRTETFELVVELLNGIDGKTAVAFSPDGRHLASGSLFGVIDLWDTTTWELARTVKSEKNRYSNLAFSPDGRLLAVGARNNQIQLWDAAALAPVGQFDGGLGRIEAVAFSPDGGLLASGSSDGGVQLWGIATP